MSIEALGWAIRQQVFPVNRKFVLVLMANYAGDNGITYPSVSTLARATGMKEETVASCIDDLVKDGILIDTGKRAGDTKRIRVFKIHDVCNPPQAGGIQSKPDVSSELNTPPNPPSTGGIATVAIPPLIPRESPANTPPNTPPSDHHLVRGTGTGTLFGTDVLPAEENKTSKETPKNVNECKQYAIEIGMNASEGEAFFDFFSSNGWKVSGRSAMKDWRAAMRYWKKNRIERNVTPFPRHQVNRVPDFIPGSCNL